MVLWRGGSPGQFLCWRIWAAWRGLFFPIAGIGRDPCRKREKPKAENKQMKNDVILFLSLVHALQKLSGYQESSKWLENNRLDILTVLLVDINRLAF